MPLQGEYEPSPAMRVRDQVEEYESSGGTPGTMLRGVRVVVISSHGASSGKLLVELQDQAARGDHTARRTSGGERAPWWERAVEVWPDYAAYQTETEREIPMFMLEPAA